MKTKPTNHSLGQTAWDAYAKAVGGKAFNGDLLPTWEAMCEDKSKAHLVNAWIASSAAVCDVVCAHIVTIIDSAKAERDAPGVEMAPKVSRQPKAPFFSLIKPTECCGVTRLILISGRYVCPCGVTKL